MFSVFVRSPPTLVVVGWCEQLVLSFPAFGRQAARPVTRRFWLVRRFQLSRESSRWGYFLVRWSASVDTRNATVG